MTAATPWLTLREVAGRIRVRQQTVTAWCRAGRFPRPIVLPGGRQLRWYYLDVERWERAQMQERAA